MTTRADLAKALMELSGEDYIEITIADEQTAENIRTSLVKYVARARKLYYGVVPDEALPPSVLFDYDKETHVAKVRLGKPRRPASPAVEFRIISTDEAQ